MSLFSSKLENAIREELGKYETPQAAALPVLKMIQDEFGSIDDNHIHELTTTFGFLEITLREVLTFYSMLRSQKHAAHTVSCCNSVTCLVLGAEKLREAFIDKTTDVNKASRTQKFTVECVPCLGVCGGGPAILVDKDRYLNVTKEKIDDILRKYEESEHQDENHQEESGS